MTRAWIAMGVAPAVGVLADLLVGADIPGYSAVFGFASCIAIILVSKWLGKAWLQRPEGYYEEPPDGC